ncbi:hypothetical protein Y1Q_0024405 [Alligator mississippiensis]|uniref:Uncharacterized protein n=1 Tax=Alligator mississippiensis TaxID=8496 RepID=A0A151M443_ALLMI|nr:hypothetical protein Y1Q_0024405 [Alligator mississippiensis]
MDTSSNNCLLCDRPATLPLRSTFCTSHPIDFSGIICHLESLCSGSSSKAAFVTADFLIWRYPSCVLQGSVVSMLSWTYYSETCFLVKGMVCSKPKPNMLEAGSWYNCPQ